MSKRRKKLVVEQWVDHTAQWITQMSELDKDGIRKVMSNISQEQFGLMMIESMHCGCFKNNGMQVYLFDKDFTKSIVNEKWADLLPDVISHAPFRSFYMKLPFNELSEGILIHLTRSDNLVFSEYTDIEQMRLFQKASLDGKGVYCGSEDDPMDNIFINDGTTIWAVQSFAIPKSIDLMFDDTDVGVYPNSLIINGISYLCSKNADINKVYEPAKNPSNKRSKKRENHYSQATWHEVGYRIGAELRAYDRKKASIHHAGSGGTIRPHMRRAHWHHFWTGPRNGDRQLILKWIAPIIVGSSNGDITSATGHRVR